VLQCVTVCPSVLQCVAVCCTRQSKTGQVCCSVLQCAQVCCSVLQCAAHGNLRQAKYPSPPSTRPPSTNKHHLVDGDRPSTACSRENETRNGHRNANQNPRWSFQVSFRRAHLTIEDVDLRFDEQMSPSKNEPKGFFVKRYQL